MSTDRTSWVIDFAGSGLRCLAWARLPQACRAAHGVSRSMVSAILG